MNETQKVILSLGSNLGNRLENLEKAVAEIQQQLGFIVNISKVYETPSWGFNSDLFLNCVLVLNCNLSAEEILSRIKNIEKKLGRIEKKSENYESRIIDIDIIAIDENIINTENLIIPHSQMHNRLFVLLPFLDLNINWIHPVLHKNIAELIANCNDKSDCKLITSDLIKILPKFNLNKLNYIAIEGNIGAGKTTLATKIAEDFNAKMVLERFADNPFLPKFYKDQNRYAFPLEMSFLADRYQQLSDDLSQFDLFKDFVVADYHLFKSLIFAKVTLQEDEFRLYKTMFDIIYKETQKPDLYIYLYQNTSRLLQNIKNRGRSYEQDIETDYLEKINKGYLDFIKSQTTLNVLIIDVSDLDFVQNYQDYLFILDKIQEKIDGLAA